MSGEIDERDKLEIEALFDKYRSMINIAREKKSDSETYFRLKEYLDRGLEGILDKYPREQLKEYLDLYDKLVNVG